MRRTVHCYASAMSWTYPLALKKISQQNLDEKNYDGNGQKDPKGVML